MNINNEKLKRLFQSYLKKHIVNATEKCPLPSEILLYLNKQIPRKKRRYVYTHISNCPSCSMILKWLLEIQMEARDLSLSVKNILKKENRSFLGFGFPLSHTVASLIGLASLSICLWTFFSNRPINFFSEERNEIKQHINWHIAEPKGKIKRSSVISFRWNYFGEADHFHIELYDESLSLIWKSENLRGRSMALSEEVHKNIPAGRTYFWIVFAHDSIGQISESDLISFKIVENH